MLVLTRRDGEAVHIGDSIIVHVLTGRNGRTRLAIEAPDDVLILRSELGDGPVSLSPGQQPVDSGPRSK